MKIFLFTVLCLCCSVFTTNDNAVNNVHLDKHLQQRIVNDLSWPLKIMMWKSNTKAETENPVTMDGRRVGIEALEMATPRRGETKDKDRDNEDNNMKMKLFRLMYETVRDSDLKVKRAELIQNHYNNSSSFEVGYLMGDISDKFNIMQDITMTLKRLYSDWKPIEHINAYEQVANQAIEIAHIIDMVKMVAKRLDEEEAKSSSSTPPHSTSPSENATTTPKCITSNDSYVV